MELREAEPSTDDRQSSYRRRYVAARVVLRIRVRRQARAHQVPVAVRALHAPDRRPELALARPRRRERRLLARVRVRPRVARPRARSVCGACLSGLSSRSAVPARSRGSPRGSRSARRRTGRARPSTRSPSARSSACRPPGTTPSARGSRSPSAASRCPPPRRRRVALSARGSTMHSCATRPFAPLYSTGIVRLEPLRDVVRVEDRDLRRVASAPRRPSCRCTSSRSAGCSRCPTARRDTAPTACVPARRHDRMARQERREVLRHADRSHARTAAAVRNAERLVQVQVADVGADVARPAQADHRVHVRAVHVHLAAVLVHDRADLA